jgi:hypothetical protein
MDLNSVVIAHLKMEATDGVADDTGGVCQPDGIFRYPAMAGRILVVEPDASEECPAHLEWRFIPKRPTWCNRSAAWETASTYKKVGDEMGEEVWKDFRNKRLLPALERSREVR